MEGLYWTATAPEVVQYSVCMPILFGDGAVHVVPNIKLCTLNMHGGSLGTGSTENSLRETESPPNDETAANVIENGIFFANKHVKDYLRPNTHSTCHQSV